MLLSHCKPSQRCNACDKPGCGCNTHMPTLNKASSEKRRWRFCRWSYPRETDRRGCETRGPDRSIKQKAHQAKGNSMTAGRKKKLSSNKSIPPVNMEPDRGALYFQDRPCPGSMSTGGRGTRQAKAPPHHITPSKRLCTAPAQLKAP